MSGPDAGHGSETPSEWLVRFASFIPEKGRVLDVASGGGRHARWLAARGHEVEAVDRDADALSRLKGTAGVATICADLEAGDWVPAPAAYSAVVVINYLHRPLLPRLIDALAPHGVLIYETFASGNERYGRPSNPAFLLRPGELIEAVRGRLRVIAYEDLHVTHPRPAAVQRICAMG
jgi:SAM-dependent methyltransferase